jgi:hypothetical protein
MKIRKMMKKVHSPRKLKTLRKLKIKAGNSKKVIRLQDYVSNYKLSTKGKIKVLIHKIKNFFKKLIKKT